MSTINKKILIGAAVVVGLGLLFKVAASAPNTNPLPSATVSIQATQSVAVTTTTATPDITPQIASPTPRTQTDSGLSNDSYYTNTYGNQVHSPAFSNTVPVGASARCGDGTYSFSQSRRGTCSHHGGVASWL